MKHLLRKFLSLTLCLCLCAAAALPALADDEQLLYGNTTTLADGFSYRHTVSVNGAGKFLECHTLTLAPDSTVRPIVSACDTIYGGMTLPQAVAWAEGLGHNIVAATNADFGYWETRIPCGMVVEDGIYKSSPDTNSVLAFGPDGAFLSLAPTVSITLQKEDAPPVTVTHLNKTRGTDGLYLYSEHFSTVSTRTSAPGWFVRLRMEEEGSLSIGGTLSLTVESVIHTDEAQPIGEGILILTAQDEAGLEEVFAQFAEGDEITLRTEASDARLHDAVWATGYGNTLIYDGSFYYPDGWEPTIAGANPRTVAGILPDGTLLVRVVDGRSSASRGLSLQAIAQQLLDEGCVYAANLDGGGSSAMGLRRAGDETVQIVNVPSDGTPRSCPSYLLFAAPDESDGRPAQLFAAEDGVFVLAGSQVPLHFLATDAALRTVQPPADVRAHDSRLGRVEDNVYIAGERGGADVLTLSSARSPAAGTATMHVITRVDTLQLRDAETGRAVSQLTPEPGAVLSLAADPGCLGRPVYFDAEAAQWSVEGEALEMTEPGVFSVIGAPGAEAAVTVTLGGRSASAAVRIPIDFNDLADHWARDFVLTLAETGIVGGTEPGVFSPEAAMRRCDFTLMLWRAAGMPESEVPCSFTDVAPDAYFAGAIAWAEQAGIARGSGDGLFDPYGPLTREQAFTLVRRAFDVLEIAAPTDVPALDTRFADAAEVSDWAAAAAAELAAMEVISGDGAQLMPKGGLTRAQMAKILCLVLAAK